MNKKLASAIPIATVGIIIVIILETITGMLNTEGWNPLVATFCTTIFPIVIVGAIVIVMMKMFVDDKLESGGSAGVLNPIVILVRKLRGQKARTPEEIAAIVDKKMVDDLFTNKPIEDDEIWEKGHEEYGDSLDTKTGTVRRPINPIVHLVRYLRPK